MKGYERPSWAKLAQNTYKKLHLNFHKQGRVINALWSTRYSQKKTCDVNAPCWTYTQKY